LQLYTFHITPFELTFLGTLFPGLTLALLLGFAKKVGREANMFLGLALVVIVLKTGGLTPFFLPALGPLLYFYVRQLTCPDLQFRRKDMLHFCSLLVGYWMPGWLILISVIIYLYLSHRLIQDFYNRLRPVLMDRPRFAFRWLDRVLPLLGLLCTLSLFNDIFFLTIAFVLIGMAADAMLKSDSGVQQMMPITDRSDAREKSRRLKEAVAANRLYEDAELTLTTLAVKLTIHPHDLSRIINVGLEKNFSDFINEFRVREVARKMLDPAYDRLTLLGIAYESGFNSQRTFNRVFKEMTGKTPVEYKNSLEKELPNDKLANPSRIRPVILRSGSPPNWAHEKLKRNYMFRNYLKIAWRNMLHNKVYSTLNIFGLAIGMAVALLIGLWAFNQYSYDRFLPNYQQAYVIKVNYTNTHDGTHTQDYVSLPLANVLRNTVPGIKYVAEADFIDFPSHDFMVGDKKLLIKGGTTAPDFLKIFQYPLVKGNINSVLKDPNSIVIDEATSKSLFGAADPINKLIKIDNQYNVKVSGVMKDFPANSSMQFHFLIPFSFAEQTQGWMKNARTSWDNNSYLIFVGLQPGVTDAQISPKIKNLIYENVPTDRTYKPEVILHALKDWRLYSDFKNGRIAGGFIDYVRMFSIIGGLILLIACINFVNLSTARSERRAREVGVRKAIGSLRRDLIFQFLTESLLITLVAFLLAILFVQLALPYFNQLTTDSLYIPYTNILFWCMMIAFAMVIGLAAGARPAFYLSAFNPVAVLKGRLQLGKASTLPRKILVVLQFSCSVAFIISTVIIYQQINYVKNRPTGYSTDRLVHTFMTKELAQSYDALRNDLLASGMVESVTKATSTMTNISWHAQLAQWPGKTAGDQNINVGALLVGKNYFSTVGMQLAQGRDFLGNWKADSSAIIVNEAAIRRMGLKNPLNQIIDFNGTRSQIIGVVKDALMESPFSPVEPALFKPANDWSSQVIYRLAPGVNPHDAIEKAGRVFEKHNPAYPFTYDFVDEEYNQKFNLETLVGKLAAIFAGLAIFISCLGLFGLAAYVAEQRTKEIGIRKVLGASIIQIWVLLTSDFIMLVIISCVVASPIALYFLSNWLQKYDYRISVGPGVFVLSAIMAIVITLVTISFQSIKTALINPVKSLRSE
jgi:putative ABC transport system permease protein